ncbi:hypothetical protein TrVFT333_001562 [Trichoderma virens FT-333]|nr:hypothetical protein TrVFT333_001562 [Trichoderma virens FT-333]
MARALDQSGCGLVVATEDVITSLVWVSLWAKERTRGANRTLKSPVFGMKPVRCLL